MGARQSKRSVDIAGAEAKKSEGTEERLEKLEEPEVGAKVQNGTPPQPDQPAKDTEETPPQVRILSVKSCSS
jgi:hypothetical protein